MDSLRRCDMRCVVAAISLVALGLASGCNVEVNKNANGEDKDVKIATPLGGIAVKTNQTDAEDLGLPAYPGAEISGDKQGEKSANVNMGFGSFKLRVKVVNYTTPDPQNKVLDFYRKALGAYGDVIECSGDRSVGSRAATAEGLSCSDSDTSHQNVHIGSKDLELKAGSQHHQHLVVFEDRGGLPTRFALVALDLPHGLDSKHTEPN
jgi:hypothetical protein